MFISLGSLVVLGIVSQPAPSSGKGFLKHFQVDGVLGCNDCLVVLYIIVHLKQHSKGPILLSLMCLSVQTLLSMA